MVKDLLINGAITSKEQQDVAVAMLRLRDAQERQWHESKARDPPPGANRTGLLNER